jgi:hypothetical protein
LRGGAAGFEFGVDSWFKRFKFPVEQHGTVASA